MNKPYTEKQIRNGGLKWPDGAKTFVQDLRGYQWFMWGEVTQSLEGGASKSGFFTDGKRSSCYSSNGQEKLIIIKKEQ